MYLRFLFLIFASAVLSINIGITPDYYDYSAKGSEQLSISFSAQIEFEDPSIPGKMTDGQLISLTRKAYWEMIDIMNSHQRSYRAIPSTMMGMISEGSIYFTSSVKNSNRDKILDQYDTVEGSPAHYIKALQGSFNGHRNGGCCAEPNGLYFYSEQNRKTGEPFKTPPVTETEPRIAVILRNGNQRPDQKLERAEDPCHNLVDRGYGCQNFVGRYQMKVADKTKPDDDTDLDTWKFVTKPNRRNKLQCPNDPQPPPRPPFKFFGMELNFPV